MKKPIIDINTKNKSFLITYQELKSLDIKNRFFFLKIYDKNLIGVDPRSSNLTEIEKSRILNECVINPWYFYREVIRIPVPGKKNGVKFRLHRGNLALLWCLHNNINTTIELPRQNYKTISACCFYHWQYDWGAEGSTFLFSNKEFEDSKLNVKRVSNIRELTPDYLKLSHKKDKNNVLFISNIEKGNTIKAVSCAKDKEGADKLGRGLTAPNLWFDEFAFLGYNKIIYMSASPAYSEAAASAKREGNCYSKLISTTPSDLDSQSGKFCKTLINNAAKFSEKLYDYSEKDLKKYIEKNSNNDFVSIVFQYYDLRRSKQWFEKQCRNVENDRDTIKREILLEWAFSSNSSPFEEEDLERVVYYQKNPIFTKSIRKFYDLEFYEELIPSRSYAVSIDVSGGLSQDNSSIVISEPETERTVAVLENNKIDTDDLFKVLVRINKLNENFFYIIERNSYGLALLQRMSKNEKFNGKIFYTELDPEADKKKIKRITGNSNYSRKTRILGINTDRGSRPLMMECLNLLVIDKPETIISPIIIKDIKTLERKKNGKIEHAEGEHDDSIMAKVLFKYAKEFHWKEFRKFLKRDKENIRNNMNVISLHNRLNAKKSLSGEIEKEEIKKRLLNQKLLNKKEESPLEKIVKLNSLDKDNLSYLDKVDYSKHRNIRGLEWYDNNRK